MTVLFLIVLNRCIAVGWLILAVLLLRFLFRSTPRKYFVVMWILVGVRILLPFSIKSPISLMPDTEKLYSVFSSHEKQPAVGMTGSKSDENIEKAEGIERIGNTELAESIGKTENTVLAEGAVKTGNMGLAESTGKAEEISGIHPIGEGEQDIGSPDGIGIAASEYVLMVATSIWAVGMSVMMLKFIADYMSVKRRIKVSSKIAKGLYLCDYIGTSFVIGLFNPKVYIPSWMDKTERIYVIKHELAHIKRQDHIWKLVGYMVLVVCWFQPLMWVAYHFMRKDIEFACDELVVSELDKDSRRSYANVLLNSRINDHASVVQLAIGDISVKERIVNIMNYKRKGIGASLIGAACCFMLAACLVTDPTDQARNAAGIQSDSISGSVVGGTADSIAGSELISGFADSVVSDASADATVGSGSDSSMGAGNGEAIEESDSNASEAVPEANPKAIKVIYEEAAKKYASEELDNCVREYFGSLLEAMEAGSAIHISWNSYANIFSYLTAKLFEARRSYALAEQPEGITDISVKTVRLDTDGDDNYRYTSDEMLKRWDNGVITFHAAVDYVCTYSDSTMEHEDVFCIALRTADGQISVVDAFMYDDEYKNALDYIDRWKPMFDDDTTETWQFAAIDKILECKEEVLKGKGEELADRSSFVSEYYSEEDFDAASKAVMARFYQSKPYCELKELYYPGDEETDRQDRYAADSEPGAIANVSHEESMVLQGKYVTGDEGKVSPALNPNAVYPDWTWILCRSQDGGWEVRDEGY